MGHPAGVNSHVREGNEGGVIGGNRLPAIQKKSKKIRDSCLIKS